MKPTTVKRTAIAAAALAVVGFGLTLLERPDTTTADDVELLFPKLRDKLNDVARVDVASGDTRFAIVRDDDGWGLEERWSYPVKLDTLRGLLIELSEARILDEKTTNPELYERLGVQDVGTGDTPNHSVRLENGRGKELAALIVGERRAGGGSASYYVREPGEERSLLVRAELRLPRDPTGWLAPEIVSVPRDRLQATRLEHADGEVVTAVRASRDERNFELIDVPEGKVARYAHVANPIPESLRNLTLSDVKPAGEVELPETPTVRATFWTFDGVEIVLDLWSVSSEGGDEADVTETHYLTAHAAEALSPYGQSTIASEADEPAEGEEDDAGVEAAADPAAEAAAIDARTDGWVYEISSYVHGNLAKRMDDLVKDAPEEEPAAEPVAEPEPEAVEPQPEAAEPGTATPGEPISSSDFEEGAMPEGVVVVPAPDEAEAAPEEPAEPSAGAPISSLDFEEGAVSGDKMETHGPSAD